jgi:P2-related tail formation protein
VLCYGDTPDWYLVGIVDNCDYNLWSQGSLDEYAQQRGLKRPQTYTFTFVDDLLDNVDQWKGKEGVCIYSKDGQAIHKVKSAWYLVRHHMKSELNNVEKVMDFWFTNGKPDFLAFKELVLQFDYEIWEQVQGNASRLSDAYKEVQRIIEGMKKFLREQVMVLNYNRRMQATIIKQSYGETNRASYLFTLLDGKELDDKQLKKLMFQVLKKL